MSDNIIVTAGTGTTILADELTHATYGLGKAQAIKLLLGAANTGVDAVGGSGTVGDGVQRVVLATDVGLPAGTSNIGDVDVLTVPADPFGVNADAGSATGSISAKLRFIAGTGIPITGTVTVGSHAVTNAGTFVVQENGAALTALQLIDNLVLAEDAAHVGGDVGVMALGVTKAASVSLGADGDYMPFLLDKWGKLHVNESLDHYETVGASQTGQALGATGATGDTIRGVLIIPASVSPGNVLLLDNATSITIFPGGTNSVLTLHPFFVPLGIKSVSGAWKLTTGANVSAIGMGQFT